MCFSRSTSVSKSIYLFFAIPFLLFEIIKTHGKTFQQEWWEDLFQIIFKTLEGDPDNNFELEMEGTNAHLKNNIKQWRATTCQHCLLALSDTIVLHKLKGVLLKRTLDKLRWACSLKVEPLSSAATNCVQTLFSGLAAVLDEEEEYSLAVCAKDLRDICEASPNVLLELVQAITNALLDDQVQKHFRKLNFVKILSFFDIFCDSVFYNH